MTFRIFPFLRRHILLTSAISLLKLTHRWFLLYANCGSMPTGLGLYPPKDTVRLGKVAIEAGVVVLCEIKDGKFHFTGRSKTLAERGKRVPVNQYMERQQRFRSMSDGQKRTIPTVG